MVHCVYGICISHLLLFCQSLFSVHCRLLTNWHRTASSQSVTSDRLRHGMRPASVIDRLKNTVRWPLVLSADSIIICCERSHTTPSSPCPFSSTFRLHTDVLYVWPLYDAMPPHVCGRPILLLCLFATRISRSAERTPSKVYRKLDPRSSTKNLLISPIHPLNLMGSKSAKLSLIFNPVLIWVCLVLKWSYVGMEI